MKLLILLVFFFLGVFSIPWPNGTYLIQRRNSGKYSLGDCDLDYPELDRNTFRGAFFGLDGRYYFSTLTNLYSIEFKSSGSGLCTLQLRNVTQFGSNNNIEFTAYSKQRILMAIKSSSNTAMYLVDITNGEYDLRATLDGAIDLEVSRNQIAVDPESGMLAYIQRQYGLVWIYNTKQKPWKAYAKININDYFPERYPSIIWSESTNRFVIAQGYFWLRQDSNKDGLHVMQINPIDAKVDVVVSYNRTVSGCSTGQYCYCYSGISASTTGDFWFICSAQNPTPKTWALVWKMTENEPWQSTMSPINQSYLSCSLAGL